MSHFAVVTRKSQDDEHVLQYLNDQITSDEMIDYLSQYDTGSSPFLFEDFPADKNDDVEYNGYYYLFSNKQQGYVGLIEKAI
jgi:hypothetical protein